MERVTLWRGAIYRHVERPTPAGPRGCPVCGTRAVAFHSWRRRAVEHPDADGRTYLVLKLAKYACENPVCARTYFTPAVAEAAPRARTSRALQRVAARRYRRGRAAVRDVAGELRAGWPTGTGTSSVLRWHLQTLAAAYPRPARLPCAGVLGIDEVDDRVGGKRAPIFTCVDRIAGLTIRLPIERAAATSLAAARRRVRALGAAPRVSVSDLWAAYPAALRAVWPRAERQRCWFHVRQWVTRTLAELLERHGATLPEAERKALNRLRFRLLAGPARQARLDERGRAALARAWELVRGTIVAEALRLRDDLRAVLKPSTSRREAREQFARLRQRWPERFQPWTGGPARRCHPRAGAEEGAVGLRGYLEEILAFFVRHFERMITYLELPGVPRTSNHAERANRCYRAATRPRDGWASQQGQRAMLVALQGFDSS